MSSEPTDPTISISVRDLMRELKEDVRDQIRDLNRDVTTGFARVEKGQESKADKTDIIRLEETLKTHSSELRDHGERLEEIERKQAADETAVTTKEKEAERRQGRLVRMYSALGALAGVGLVILTYVLAHH